MLMFLATGLTLLSVATPLTGAGLAPAMVVRYLGNNGSLPPPHRRSTEISIAADGQCHYRRQHGYDQSAADQRFEAEFTLDEAALQGFSQKMTGLGAMDLHWREQERPPVGGSVVMVRLSQAGRVVDVPAFPVPSQQELAAAIRSAVMGLVPEAVLSARAQWERHRCDEE